MMRRMLTLLGVVLLLAACTEEQTMHGEAGTSSEEEGGSLVGGKILAECLPPGFIEWARSVDDEATRALDGPKPDYFKLIELLRRRSRDLFQGEVDHAQLLRIVGCVPMRWNEKFYPEQTVALRCLEFEPVDLLDDVIVKTPGSSDLILKRGACRFVFVSDDGIWGAREEDLTTWMSILVRDAYSEPWAGNRRLVLARILKHRIRTTAVRDVAIRAVRDPDQTVRRRAYDILGLFKHDRQAKDALQRVARGTIVPDGSPRDEPQSSWTGAALFSMPSMEAKPFLDSDAAAARKILKVMESQQESGGKTEE